MSDTATREQRHRAARGVLGALGFVTFCAAAVPLATLPGLGLLGPSNLVYFTLFFVGLPVYWALGALIVTRAHGNAVGWWIATAAAMTAAAFAAYAFGLRLMSDATPGAAWSFIAAAALYSPAMILAGPAVFITFPTGRVPGPRWRSPVLVVVTMAVLGVLGILARPGPIDAGLPDNPAATWFPAVPPSALDALDALGHASLAVGAALGLAAILTRFRRANGEERQQLKLCLAALVPPAILLPLGTVGTTGDIASNMGRMASGAEITDILTIVTIPLGTVAITVAILRYRLFEIDRLVSRTISYLIITVLLVGTYAAVIIVLQGPLGAVTGRETISVAISTLVVAMLFQTVRGRVQSIIDQRFDRARFNAEQTTLAFSERLRNEVDIEAVTADLNATVMSSIRPARIGLWLRGHTR